MSRARVNEKNFLHVTLVFDFKLNFKIMPEGYIKKILKFGISQTFVKAFEI